MADQFFNNEKDGTSEQRVSVEHRKQLLTQPIKQISVSPSPAVYNSPWNSCSGYDRVAVTANIYGQVTTKGITCNVEFSHDGINVAGSDQVIGTSSLAGMIGKEIPILGEYFRIVISNPDNTARLCDAWGLLKC